MLKIEQDKPFNETLNRCIINYVKTIMLQYLTKYSSNYDVFIKHSNVEVHKYQQVALDWCIKNEEINTDDTLFNDHRGGIYADEMGLGKTITTLSLLSTRIVPHTLIVLPPILISQWKESILKCCYVEPLIFYGAKRKNITLEQIKQSPIVITSYALVKDLIYNNLHSTGPNFWNRIIFDEAHHIRNYKSKHFDYANTLCHLNRNAVPKLSVWCLTGTPINNRKSDLYSLYKLLGMETSFITTYYDTIKNEKLLFRTKTSVGIPMPKLVKNTITLDWDKSSEEFALAIQLHNNEVVSRNTLTDKVSDNETVYRFGTIAKYVREHHSCIHPCMLKTFFNSSFGKNKGADILSRSANTLVNSKNYGMSSKIRGFIKTLTSSIKNEPTNNRIIFYNYHSELRMIQYHIGLLINYLKNTQFDYDPEIISMSGRVSQKHRMNSINSKDERPKILFLQLSMCCEGLNLQQYNEIYFITPCVNPAKEEQAIGRCYRKGQTKTVTVYRFIMDELQSNYYNNLSNTIVDSLKHHNILDDTIRCISEFIGPQMTTKKIILQSSDQKILQISNKKQELINDEFTT